MSRRSVTHFTGVSTGLREPLINRPMAGFLRYEGLSNARIHAWRQQMDFPVAVYGGGQFATQGVRGTLPTERSPSPRIAGDFREVMLTAPTGPQVGITVSGGAGCSDGAVTTPTAPPVGCFAATAAIQGVFFRAAGANSWNS